MPDSPHSDHLFAEGSEIFEPSEADRDLEAEAQMQQGRVDLDPDNALYDPYFKSPDHALTWAPYQEAE